jgi:hypothetical protein
MMEIKKIKKKCVGWNTNGLSASQLFGIHSIWRHPTE